MGMENTETVYYESDTANYTRGYDKSRNIMPHITFQIAGAAGGLKSTAYDMVRYIEENIKEDDEAIYFSHQKTIEKNDQAYGLGWQVSAGSAKDIHLWHDGGEPGFSSFCLIYPGKKTGIICLTNQRSRQSQLSNLCRAILATLMKNPG